MPTIEVHGRPVKTRFGLLGNDENALTAALAYCMSRDIAFLRQILRLAGVQPVRDGALQAAQIRVQRHREHGITDIDVLLGKHWHIIFEAKIGLSVPSAEQVQRYLRILDSSRVIQTCLVLVLAVDSADVLHRLRRDLGTHRTPVGAIFWADLSTAARATARRTTAVASSDLRDFARFMEDEYYMRAYTNEVWIVAANTTPLWPSGLSFVDTHLQGRIYYRTNRPAVRPLYLALRFDGQVRAVQKVLGVEHDRCPIDSVPELRHVEDEWPHRPHTIWRLGEPVPLPRPIPTGDPKMQARMVSCDFVDLLTCQTVREIERKRATSSTVASSS